MSSERYQRVGEIFHAALGLAPEARPNFLDEACGGEEELRREVESLLQAREEADGFIAGRVAGVVAEMATLQQSPSLLGHRISHYQVLSLLGAGGMGEVYLADDTSLRRKVALKLLPPAFTRDPERLHRFKQEARSVSALNHPNILTIYEVGVIDETHFIATEFIDGRSLRELLHGQPLELSEALDIAIQIAAALTAAHEAGIIHRDIKPENVMVRRDGIVKVLDFGLAKLTEPVVTAKVGTETPTLVKMTTEAGRVLGTPQYMSPEQARGQKADARSDIFSLGVVLYEMLSGQPPFVGESPIEVMAAILNREPAPLNQSVAGPPDELPRIVGKALRKNREERYQTAGALLSDLKRLKEELAFTAQLERAGPSIRKAVTAPANAVPTAAIKAATSTSNAKTNIGGVKWRKLVSLLALLALIAAAAALLAFYWRTQSTEGAIDSIAVLPFTNQNRAGETDYLADGLTESIINNLAQLPNLRVIARSSVFRYKDKETDPLSAGQELRVRAVVTGRLLQRGESLVISTEMIDVRENKQLWGQQYNRKLADVLTVQGEIAREISGKLRAKLSGAEQQQLAKRPTENLKAFQYYTQGRAYFQRRTREDHLTAIRYFEKAIEEDPNYALAYASLAVANTSLGGYGYIAPTEGQRRGEKAARKALALDENLAEAHAALGVVSTVSAPANFSLGERELRRAIELSPGSAIAHQYLGTSLVQQGRLDEALEEYLKARELDPLSSVTARQLAAPYYFKRDYTQSLELLRQANELGPAFSTTWEIGVYIQNRLLNETFADLEKAKRERGSDSILIYSTGMIYAARGERTAALKIIKELEELSGASLIGAHWIAKIYSALNEKEMAFSWLERGLGAGTIGFFYKDEPVWDAIRGEARFGELLRRMGVPQ
jgi:serine/threonine protein kinase/TolB-like protein/Tfp pilus assembly protein PilF